MGRTRIKGLFKNISIAMSAVLLCSFVMQYITLPVKAAGSSGTYANLVIFVRMNGDDKDEFNTGTNWQQIKDMYDNKNNSFSKYISAISEGKVQVINYFPQEWSDGNGVDVFTLSKSIYGSGDGSSDAIMVGEILDAIRDGKIPLGDYKLDNQQSGIVDNLTIIVQGDDINGNAHAYHKTYAGTESIKSDSDLKVCNYNAIPSHYLIREDGDAGNNTTQQQGVISHEFMHTLGFADLYQYGESSNTTVGIWDIMATNGWNPQYPLSYSRVKQGWIDSEEITESGTYTLKAVTETSGTRLYTIRTPLSEGQSEIICLEYRKRNIDYYTDTIERSVFTGLLMYRVDEKVTSMSNAYGDNYYYVFRPGDAAEKSAYAAIGAGTERGIISGLTEFGSTDLTKNDKTDNIIYYSDGQNSGIKISNVSINGTELTFTIDFADYDSADVMGSVGGNVADDVSGDAYLYSDDASGTLYAAYLKGEVSNSQIVVKKINPSSDSGSWEQVGNAVNSGNSTGSPQISMYNGELYLLYHTRSGCRAAVAKYSSGSWQTIYTGQTDYAVSPQLITDDTGVYLAYTASDYSSNKSTVYIYNVLTGSTIATKTGEYMANPAVGKMGNKFYLAYSFYLSGDKKARIVSYDTVTKAWSDEHTCSTTATKYHDIQVHDNKLYVFFGADDDNAVLSVYDGSSWSDVTISQMKGAYSPSYTVINQTVYLSYADSSGTGKLIKQSAAGIESVSDNLGLKLLDIVMCSYGNTIYVGTRSDGTDTLTVVSRQTADSGSQTDTPSADDDAITASSPMTLELVPPSGYNDDRIYIDGVEYTAARSDGRCTLALNDTNGQTAVMYSYNSSNVPVGMYVWKLSYNNGYCTAKPLKGLENLLSYHGFSIRIKGDTGIRFKSGIDTTVKNKLINSNVDGYKLLEYGTLYITEANRKTYPFVYLGEKVGRGRSYWVDDNGKVKDYVFETVSGRSRFTSVLTKLPESQYATEIAFRSYIILESDEGSITVYGPPVSRSIYAVAKQVLNKGEFPVGSSGYNYVKNIVDTVETK
jgi:M6 family metalloprotease-like protein